MQLNMFLGLFDAIEEGEQASVEYFNKWMEEVKGIVPEEKLLIFDVRQGWQPLCQFLDVPVPNQDFPNTNDTKMMKQRMRNGKILAYTLVFGFPLLLGILLYFIVLICNT